MKKTYLFLILVSLLITVKGFSQAIYTGGESGGYATLSVSTQTDIQTEKNIEPELKISIYPNPISEYKEINASSSDFVTGQSITLSIYDLLGNLLDKSDYQISEQIVTLNLPWSKMSKGMYLFVFKVDNKSTTVRVSMN